MREIKFRAWDKKNKQMLHPPSEIGNLMFSEGQNYDHITKYDAEIMQYTGLKDKNGKDVYEGDIIEFEEPVMESAVLKCPVVFRDGMFVAEWDSKSAIRWFPLNDIVQHENDWEVIGNEWENPELLALREK